MPLTPELLKDKLDEGWQLGDLYRWEMPALEAGHGSLAVFGGRPD